MATSPSPLGELHATSLDVDGAVATVTLRRAQAANARNQVMRTELARIWDHLAQRDDVNAVVLTGEGDRFFCAGMDLKEAGQPESPEQRRARLLASRDIEQLASLPQPTIAAINGYALGGGFEMALACDLRLIAEHAQVGLTEVGHGLVPGGGGTQRLPRLVGLARAAEMLYLGRRLSGPEAAAWGVANRCVPGDELLTSAAALAGEVATQPRRALVQAKELLRLSAELPQSPAIEHELEALLVLLAERQANDSSAPPSSAP